MRGVPIDALRPEPSRRQSPDTMRVKRVSLKQALFKLSPQDLFEDEQAPIVPNANIITARAIEHFAYCEFGIHPDQLFSNAFLQDGRISKNPAALYGIALRLLDLQDLKHRGYLAMEPVDFLRWRIGEILLHKQKALYTICQRISGSDTHYNDPVLRFVMHHVDDIARNRESTIRKSRLASRISKRPSKLSKLQAPVLCTSRVGSPEVFRQQRAKDERERQNLCTRWINRPKDMPFARSHSILLSPKESLEFERRRIGARTRGGKRA